MNAIREKLWEEHGVLLLTAENNFASPLTPEGKIYAAVEAMRSTEENRVKAHQVLRAKRDTIELGYWPGGPPPRGFVLKKIIQSENGSDKFVGSELVIDSRTINVNIIKEAFRVSKKTGIRGSALATKLKALPQFKDEFKDLTGDTVNNWLSNTLYKGTLTWGLFCTGIVNDVRRLERNDPEDVVIKEDFCEPIVSEKDWDLVNMGHSQLGASTNDESGKLLSPLAPGFKIKYMLSGLARCGCCGGSMTPVANKSKSGVRYVYYRCQRTSDDNCDNHAYIHEPWLREQVIGYISNQILGVAERQSHEPVNDGVTDPEFRQFEFGSKETAAEIRSLVEDYLEKQSSTENDSRPAIAKQISEIDELIRGWTQTLGHPSLPHEVRRSIETDFNEAIESKAELEEALAQLEYVFASRSFRLDDQKVLGKMTRLSDVLAESNPSLVNIELSLHIDKILCKPDGTVTVRFCKLGLAGIEVINSIGLVGVNNKPVVADSEDMPDGYVCTPRRRARLSASSNLYSSWDLECLAHWATDPHRFDYMDDCWFEEVTFVRPEQLCWAEENAIDIAECRLNDRLTEAALAEKFGVCILTIRKGLKIASQLDSKYADIPKKMPRARWHEDHAAEVHEANKRMMMKDMVSHFGKSDIPFARPSSMPRGYWVLRNPQPQ